MAFYGSYFTFDGVSCRDYNLMIYDFGSSTQEDTVAFGSTGTAIEDRIANRYSSLFYGIKQDVPLTFSLTFGADCCLLEKGRAFKRPEVARIASWLTGHNTWKWLAIEQPDMLFARYKCYISGLRLITYDGKPWAFNCTVTCDSPYAYLEEDTLSFSVNGTDTIEIENLSSYHGYYYPYLIIDTTDRANITIVNTSDSNRTFSISQAANAGAGIAAGIPSGKRFRVDNENQIITVSAYNSQTQEYEADATINPYALFNNRFLGLVPGVNTLTLTGSFDLQVVTAFPVDIGA